VAAHKGGLLISTEPTSASALSGFFFGIAPPAVLKRIVGIRVPAVTEPRLRSDCHLRVNPRKLFRHILVCGANLCMCLGRSGNCVPGEPLRPRATGMLGHHEPVSWTQSLASHCHAQVSRAARSSGLPATPSSDDAWSSSVNSVCSKSSLPCCCPDTRDCFWRGPAPGCGDNFALPTRTTLDCRNTALKLERYCRSGNRPSALAGIHAFRAEERT
jgi:hypothetical protein